MPSATKTMVLRAHKLDHFESPSTVGYAGQYNITRPKEYQYPDPMIILPSHQDVHRDFSAWQSLLAQEIWDPVASDTVLCMNHKKAGKVHEKLYV